VASNVAGKTWVEGVPEQGTEENIWTYDAESKSKLEKTAT
jgi:hypothetical protein